MIVVLQQGSTLTKDDIMAYMKDSLHKLSVPDDVVFVDELPHTATGKLNKLALREKFADYSFPEVA